MMYKTVELKGYDHVTQIYSLEDMIKMVEVLKGEVPEHISYEDVDISYLTSWQGTCEEYDGRVEVSCEVGIDLEEQKMIKLNSLKDRLARCKENIKSNKHYLSIREASKKDLEEQLKELDD